MWGLNKVVVTFFQTLRAVGFPETNWLRISWALMGCDGIIILGVIPALSKVFFRVAAE